jgi:septal ring factor EnvC (AmiA/AmiB activator)
MAQQSSNELQKKRMKVEKEYKRLEDKFKQAQEAMKNKEMELKRIDADLVAALLVENDLTMSELPEILKKTKEPQPLYQQHN